MPTLKQLEDRATELATKQLALVNDETRPWSDRTEEYERLDVDIKSTLEQHAAVKGIGDLQAKLSGGKIEDVPSPARTVPESPEVKSWGQQIVESEAFKEAQGASKASKFTTCSIEVKDFAIGTSGAQGTAWGGVIPQYLPGVTDILFKRLVVRDLLAQGVMTSAVLTYLKESAVTNAAAARAEGAAKPASALTLVQVSEVPGSIATTLKATTEALEDVAFAQSYIDGRLRLFVQIAEEDELLNGSGTAPHLTGLNNRSGLTTAHAYDAATETQVDAIFKEITAIRLASFLDPDGIVINPSDWETIRLLKDGNEQYYGGGPFTGAYGNGAMPVIDSLWGLPVVVTPSQAQGTALIGAFRTAAQVFQRSPLRVDVTNSNEDDFLKNKIAFRAEERVGLAVYRPGAFGKVTSLV